MDFDNLILNEPSVLSVFGQEEVSGLFLWKHGGLHELLPLQLHKVNPMYQKQNKHAYYIPFLPYI